MSEPMDPAQDHPEELLAAFVDGTAPASERRTVDAHLASCPRCRQEVELATAGRVAIASLPELDAPGLAAAGMESLRRAGMRPVPSPAEPSVGSRSGASLEAPVAPAMPRRRIAWAQLAAAAVVVALVGGLVAIPLLLSGGGGGKRASAPNAVPATPTASLPPLIDRNAAYTPATLDALAAGLATAQRTAQLAPAARSATTAAAPQPLYGGATVSDATAVNAALTCLIRGGGPAGAVPVYLELAEVSGTPAYIGAFRLAATKLNLVVIAVSQEGCQPLYSVRRSI